MADKKIEKALYGPSTTEVALGALLGFALGVVVAVVYLVWKPVLRVTQMPKDPVPNAVYFLPGTENSTKGRAWQAKVKTLTNGGVASFTEEELNAFGATIEPPPPGTTAKPAEAPKPPKPAKPGDPAKPAEESKPQGDIFTVSDLNFHILKSDKLQISLKCIFNYYGIGTDVYVVATGTFARNGENYAFLPDTYYFGSCPLHKLPVGAPFITSHILGAFKLPDSMRAWDKITSIKVEGGLLKVTTSP